MFPTDQNPTQSIVVARMLEFKADLAARDAATILTMGKRWMQLEAALEANISLLVLELQELQAAGQVINIQRVYKIRRYQTLLAQMRKEMTSYNLWAADHIAQNQIVLGVLGINHAAEAITLTMLEGVGAVGPFFDKIPFSAVELMVGNAGKGGPVYDLLQEAYPTAVENMTNILIQNIAMGIGPGETAKAMVVGMEGALSHALTVARTEQLRVYRESSRQQYESTGAVLGYKRFAAKDGLTCALCLALDGEVYKTNELMNVHPCDRCTMIPIVRGVSEITWESGEDWLRGQPEEVQIKTLGPGAHEMWKNGDIELKDLVNKVDHPIWGPSLQRNTLASLRGEGGLSPLIPDTGLGQWKPNMTSDEAALWASNSKITGPVYHGTGLTERGVAMSPDDLSARIEAITNEGFIVPEKYTNGNMLGRGVYVIPDPSRAARYGEVLELRINVKNPLILEQQEWSKQYQRIIREMKKAGLDLSPQERITWWVEKEGIDAIQITNALPQIVVFDPKNITVVIP